MDDLKKWETLHSNLRKGSLALLDLAFAQSVLKKLGSLQEEHAAFLTVLFAVSRQGHLMLDVSPEGLNFALKLLEIKDVDSLSDLVLRGAATFPKDGISDGSDAKQGAWIFRSGLHYYLQKNWVYESAILTHLERLKKSAPAISLGEWEPDPCLNDAQRKAVEQGMHNGLSLLTGGPGTGKTFTAVELVKACLSSLSDEQRHQFRIIITAPTGKAVAQLEGNLRRAIGDNQQIRSGTLHAVLGIKSAMQEEEVQPLFADLVIVDECSMIDAKIFARLLASASSGTRLILIGDKDQLPPVEAGSVFADLIDSGMLPSTQLIQSLRSDRKDILSLAKSIREGLLDNVLSFLNGREDIEWTDIDEKKHGVSQVYRHLWDCCKDKFPSTFAEKPTPQQILGKLGAFSILSCMRRGALGVDAINSYFLNQYLKEAIDGAWWASPVMITRNDHELQLFNGDIGFIVRKMGPDFSLRELHIEDYALFHDRKGGFRQLSALALNAFEYSYCLSVHKSQGSEYEEVLILVPEGSESFGREVVYTAVTRARRKVILAGSQDILRRSIAQSSRKSSGIKERLRECMDSKR